MQRKIEALIKILVGFTFFVPLILAPAGFIFPFIVPKILIFRSLSIILLGCYVLLLYFNWEKYKITVNWINVAVGLFLLSLAISTFVGVDWYKSFWDNHERMLGLFTIAHFIIYYAVLFAVVRDWREWKWFFRLFLFAGAIVMLLGAVQKVDPNFLLNRGSGRVSATLGNAIYYSGYGLFLFFIGTILAVKEKNKRGFWFWYSLLLGLLGFGGIFWGQTRGTLLGLIASSVFVCGGYLFFGRSNKKASRYVMVLFVLLLIIFSSLFAFRKSKIVSSVAAVEKLFNVSLTETTASTRFMAWRMAVDGWKERPVFGWGPNNYYYVFNKYYQPEFLRYGWSETWFDNAHSAVFNTLAVQGLFGLFTYFLLFIVPVYCLWRGWKNGVVDLHIFILGSGFLVGHFIHNSTVFENPTSYLYFFFFLAFINSQVVAGDGSQQFVKKANVHSPWGAVSTTAVLTLLFVYFTNINPARANTSTLELIKSVYSAPQLVMERLSQTLQIGSPHIDDIRNDFAKAISEAAPTLMQRHDVALLKNWLDASIIELEKNKILHPLDIRTHLQLAQQYTYQAQIFDQTAYLRKAEENLTEAMVFSPRRQVLSYMLSYIKLLLGKPQEGIELLEAAVKDDLKISESWARLAFIYNQSGNNAKAREVIQQAQNQDLIFAGQGQAMVEVVMGSASAAK